MTDDPRGEALAGVRARALRRTFFWALLAVTAQLGAGFHFAVRSDPPGAAALVRYDALRHMNIAANGYALSRPGVFDASSSNVYCFPAFPMAARLATVLTRLDARDAVLAVSWLFAFLFWWMFFFFLATSGAPAPVAAAGGLFALSFPTSWYGVVGYSESMFCALVLAALHAGAKGRWKAAAVAVFIASLTRPFGLLLGAALAFSAGVVRALRRHDPVARRRLPPWRGVAAILAAGLAGPALFMLYCEQVFGRWNLYWTTQVSMSAERPSFAHLLSPFVWRPSWPPPGGDWRAFDAVSFGGYLVPFYMWAMAGAVAVTLARPRRGDGAAAVFQGALPLAALGSVVISLSIFGGTPRMWGLVRYLFVPHVLMVLWVVCAAGPSLPRRFSWPAAAVILAPSVFYWGKWWLLLRRYAAGLFVG